MKNYQPTIVGFATLIVLLSAGAAQSLSGSNTVFGDDIVDGTITTPDLKVGSISGSRLLDSGITSSKIYDNTVTGNDVNEGTLNAPITWQNFEFEPEPEFDDPAPFGEGTQAPRFGKGLTAIIHLEGTVRPGLDGGTVELLSVLPVGFRPAHKHTFPVACGATIGGDYLGVVHVLNDGQVMLSESSSGTCDGRVSLDGIVFGIN